MSRRRRWIAAAVASAVVLSLSWLGSIGYFSRTDAVTEAHSIRLAALDALQPIITARKAHAVDDDTFRAAMVRANELEPLMDALMQLAQAKQAHRWSIAAAYRYNHLRGPVVAKLEQLENFRAALPASTTRAI